MKLNSADNFFAGAGPRIIFSSYDDVKNSAYGGGGAAAVHAVAKRLARACRVSVLTGGYQGAKDEVIDGVSYSRLPTSWAGPKLGQLVFHMLLPFYVLKSGFDVWVESFTPPFSTSCLPLFTKKPVIGLAHMLSAAEMRRKYRLPLGLVENLGLRLYRRVITPSQKTAEKIGRINPRAEVVVIPNGLEAERGFVPGPPGDFFLYVGRIEINQKGLDLLLQAYAKVKSGLGRPLYIAGSGNPGEEKKLIALVKSLNLSAEVKLVGRVGGRRKEQLYASCLCVVAPSRSETFPMVALEALSHGKALLCFDIDGFAWLPEDCAIKVKPASSDALAESLLAASSNPQSLAATCLRGWSFARQFSWEDSSARYGEFIAKSAGK